MSNKNNNYKKYANEILDDIECYKLVLQGSIKRFPLGFWTKPWSYTSAALITRYLLEERLKYTEKDIKTKVDAKLFQDNKLSSLVVMFDGSPYKIMDNAYPNKYKPWELNTVSHGFWENEYNVKEAIRWLVENKLDNNRERVCKEFSKDLLVKHGIASLGNYGLYNLLNLTYPDEFKTWELIAVAPRFWEDENNIKEAVKWLVRNKLDNNRERVCKEFNQEFLSKCNMSSLNKYGLYNLINITYPNEFKPWELISVPRGFWDDENNVIKVVRWLVETKLDNNRERVCKEFGRDFLYKYNATYIYRYGIYNLINMAYPNEYKPWEFQRVPHGFWENNDNIKKAVHWLVENELDNNKDRVLREFNKEFVIKHGLRTLAKIGIYNVLNIAYPNEFKQNELKK